MASSTNHASKPVLAVVDLQSGSRQVLEHALSLGREHRSSVLALHVVHESEKSAGFYRRHDDGNHVLPMKEIAAKLLEQLVAEVISEHAGEAGLPEVGMRVVPGIPAGRIVEVAEREDVDTIVMVNDDCCGLERLWHGSIAEEVLKRTDRNMALLHEELESVTPFPELPRDIASQPLAG